MPHLKNLRPAQQIALRHLARGLTDRQIAELMGLSQDAIVVLFAEVAERLGVPGQNEVAELAKAAIGVSGQSKLAWT